MKRMTEAQMLACYERQDDGPVVRYLYKHSPWKNIVRRKVKEFGGTTEDYEDIFSETVVAFNASMMMGTFQKKASLKTYFLSISGKKCMKMLEKRDLRREGMKGYVSIAAAMRAEEIYGPDWEERYERLLLTLKQLDDKQRKLVELFMAGWKHEAIARAIDLKNADTSKSTFNRIKNFVRKVMKFVLFLFSLT